MAEIVDVACDICGKIYHWTEERLGDVVTCSECGTKFDVTEYVAPAEDGEVDVNNNPLPWIKGAFVVALILCVLLGLSSLVFIRPNSGIGSFVGSTSSSGAGSNWSTQPIPAPRPWGQPHQEEPRKPVVVPAIGMAPLVTGWTNGKNATGTNVRLIGQGLQNVSKVQEFNDVGLFDSQFQIHSDAELEIKQVQFDNPKSALFTVSNAEGMTVVFCQEIKTVVGSESLNDRTQLAFGQACFVRKGARFETNQHSVVLAESGAKVVTAHTRQLAIMEQGTELSTGMFLSAYTEPGAMIKTRIRARIQPALVRDIRFCPLPILPPAR